MKRIAKIVKARVKALTDPQPEYVSLVGHGANQTPFKAVKADNAEQAVEVTAKEAEPMAVAIKQEGYEIASLEFSAKRFTSEQAVKNWLEDGGYQDYEISATQGGFEVVNKNAPEFEGDPQPITTAQGVTAHVGKIKVETPAEKSEEQVAQESAETAGSHVQPVAKGDEPSAETSGDAEDAVKMDEEQVKAKTAELTQKSMYNVHDLAEVLGVLRWVLSDTSFEAEYDGADPSIPEQVKEHIRGLANILNKIVNQEVQQMTEKTQKTEAAAEAAEVEKTEQAEAEAEGATAEKAETEAPAENDAEDQQAEKTEDTAEAASKDEDEQAEKTDENTEEGAEPAAKSNEDPIAALTALVGDVATSVKGLTEKVDELSQKQDEAEERVKSLEGGGQTRKSADADEASAQKSESTQKASSENDEFKQRQFRNALGI